MIEETVTAAAVCITAAIFSTLLKQYCREHALFCVIGACAAVGIAAAAYLTPVVSQMQALFERTNLPSAYLTILWKALGICYLTGIAHRLYSVHLVCMITVVINCNKFYICILKKMF